MAGIRGMSWGSLLGLHGLVLSSNLGLQPLPTSPTDPDFSHRSIPHFDLPLLRPTQATLRLTEHIQQAIRKLNAEGAESRTKVLRFLDANIFSPLIGAAT